MSCRRAVALDRLGGDEELFAELKQVLLEEAVTETAGIESAIQSEDAKTVQRLAHTLKGAAANMGAEPLREVAAQMEAFGEARDLAAARQHLPGLEEAVAALKTYLGREESI